MIILFASSCCREPQIKDISISPDNLAIASAIDTIFVSSHPQDICQAIVVNDSIIVFSMNYERGRPVIEIHPITDINNQKDLFYYGPGQDSTMFSIMTCNEDKVLLYDFMKKQISIVDIQSYVQGHENSYITKNTNIDSQRIIPIDKKRIIYLNPDSFNYKEKRVRGTRIFKKLFPPKMSRTIDVVHGHLLYNKKRHLTLYANSVESTIEIIDRHFNTIIRLNGPGQESNTYYVNNNGFYTYKNKVTSSYSCISGNDNIFVAAYCHEESDAWHTIRSDYSTLIFFDWEGNIISSYLIPSYVINVSLTSDGKNCFCFEENKKGEKSLVKYEL